MAKFVIEDEILFTNKKMFGDDLEHAYECKCYDGFAIGTSLEEDMPKKIRIIYPLRHDIVSDHNKAHKVLHYRGLHDLSVKDITYGDIMICMGVIEPIKTRKIINNAWSLFDKKVGMEQLKRFNAIYLDEYGCPMDMEIAKMLHN